MWWIRSFKIISTEYANKIGLKWIRNIYGDEINHINCRSLWIDKKGRWYRIEQLRLS